MKKSGKKVISIIVDILLLAVIVLAVYLLVVDNFISININLLYIIIIAAIPVGFYLTYMSFAKDIDWDAPCRDEDAADSEEAGADDEKNKGKKED